MPDLLLFVFTIFAIALLYASVGHGGASGYLAVMALFAVAPELLRPTALTLNLVVSFIGTVAFYQAGYFRIRLFWPLALCSVPFAYIGGSVTVPDIVFRFLLAFALLVAVGRLFMSAASDFELRKPGLILLLPSGAAIGLTSGLIGVGGGIFLTPLAIIMRWGSAKTAAAISAPFIFLNSMAGLLGLRPSVADFHPQFGWMLLAVIVAGFIGSRWGSRIANSRQIRQALGIVLLFAAGKLMFH